MWTAFNSKPDWQVLPRLKSESRLGLATFLGHSDGMVRGLTFVGLLAALSACSKVEESAANKTETVPVETATPTAPTVADVDNSAALAAAQKAAAETKIQAEVAKRRADELEERIRFEDARNKLMAEQNRLLSEQNARLAAQQLDEQQRALIAQQQALIDAQARATEAQAQAAAAQTAAAQAIVDSYRRDRRQVIPSPPRKPHDPNLSPNRPPVVVDHFTPMTSHVTGMTASPVTGFPGPDAPGR